MKFCISIPKFLSMPACGLALMLGPTVMGQNSSNERDVCAEPSPCRTLACVVERIKGHIAADRFHCAFDNLESASGYPASEEEAHDLEELRRNLFLAIEAKKDEAIRARDRADSLLYVSERLTEEQRRLNADLSQQRNTLELQQVQLLSQRDSLENQQDTLEKKQAALLFQIQQSDSLRYLSISKELAIKAQFEEDPDSTVQFALDAYEHRLKSSAPQDSNIYEMDLYDAMIRAYKASGVSVFGNDAKHDDEVRALAVQQVPEGMRIYSGSSDGYIKSGLIRLEYGDASPIYSSDSSFSRLSGTREQAEEEEKDSSEEDEPPSQDAQALEVTGMGFDNTQQNTEIQAGAIKALALHPEDSSMVMGVVNDRHTHLILQLGQQTYSEHWGYEKNFEELSSRKAISPLLGLGENIQLHVHGGNNPYLSLFGKKTDTSGMVYFYFINALPVDSLRSPVVALASHTHEPILYLATENQEIWAITFSYTEKAGVKIEKEIPLAVLSDTSPITALAYTPQKLIVGTQTGMIHTLPFEYDAKNSKGKPLLTLPLPVPIIGEILAKLPRLVKEPIVDLSFSSVQTPEAPISAIEFNPHKGWVAVASLNGFIYIWNLNRPDNPILVLEHPDTWVRSMKFLGAYPYLVSGTRSGELFLWPLEPYKLYQELKKRNSLIGERAKSYLIRGISQENEQ